MALVMNSLMQDLEHEGLEEAENDEEPVFVLTDEWMEFFAKSEAKRKLGCSLFSTYSFLHIIMKLQFSY